MRTSTSESSVRKLYEINDKDRNILAYSGKVFEHSQEGKMTIQQTEKSTNRVSDTPNVTAVLYAKRIWLVNNSFVLGSFDRPLLNSIAFIAP